MAIGAGIVDWDADAFVEGVKGLFRDWAKTRGREGSIEEAQVLAIARSYFGRYGESHFDNIDEPDIASLKERPVADRSGYRTGFGETRRWFVFPQVFSEIFVGVNPQKAAKILHRHGMLEAGNEVNGRFDKKVRFGDGFVRPRVFVVTSKVVEGLGEPDADLDPDPSAKSQE
jgi:hypothetical protein